MNILEVNCFCAHISILPFFVNLEEMTYLVLCPWKKSNSMFFDDFEPRH
jgi:hypothetical protein